MTKTKKTNVQVKSYTRKDGTRVRASQRSIETNNIRNTYELQRRRKGKELLRDIGSGLSLGLIKPSEITRKRTSVRKAQAAGILLNRVDRRGLAEATRIATNDYQINPNSKKALAEINKLENRARIAGTKPERYRKLAALYEKEMEKGGYQGMKYKGTDFSSTKSLIEFGRGKDKKKRKRRGTAIDVGVATGAAVTSGALAYKGSIRRDRRQFDAEVAADANKVLERSRNNPLNRESFENLDNLTSRQSIAQDAQNKLSALNQQLEGQPNLNPKLAQRAREKLSAKYGNITQELPSLGKQITDTKGKILASEKLRSANKLRASRLALAAAAVAGTGGYLASRAIRRRRDK